MLCSFVFGLFSKLKILSQTVIHFSRNKSDPLGFGNEIYSWLLHLRKKIFGYKFLFSKGITYKCSYIYEKIIWGLFFIVDSQFYWIRMKECGLLTFYIGKLLKFFWSSISLNFYVFHRHFFKKSHFLKESMFSLYQCVCMWCKCRYQISRFQLYLSLQIVVFKYHEYLLIACYFICQIFHFLL